jgi:hypothetical protein
MIRGSAPDEEVVFARVAALVSCDVTMPESNFRPEAPESPEAARHYAWPKYVLGAVALFFTICILWTVKEVTRLRRAKADGMEMRGGTNEAASRTNLAPGR